MGDQGGGRGFFLSCRLDCEVEPRWRPEWIANRHLMADAVGRVLNAWRGLEEAARPQEWRPFIETGERWIEGDTQRLACDVTSGFWREGSPGAT